MMLGYARVSKSDGSQSADLQTDALLGAGVERERIYRDEISGAETKRPGLEECLRACRAGDALVVWKLDRLGRSLPHLIETVQALRSRGVGFRSLTEGFDTSTPAGELFFHVIAALAQFERDLIRERTRAGLRAARARGRLGGRPRVRLEKLLGAAAAMSSRAVRPDDVCREYGISRASLYHYIAPGGSPRGPMLKMLEARGQEKGKPS